MVLTVKQTEQMHEAKNSYVSRYKIMVFTGKQTEQQNVYINKPKNRLYPNPSLVQLMQKFSSSPAYKSLNPLSAGTKLKILEVGINIILGHTKIKDNYLETSFCYGSYQCIR